MTRPRLRLRDEAGYSLVEMIAVMAILGTVLGGITGLFVSGSKAQVHMQERFQAQSMARMAMDRLRRDVHCASSATVGGTSAVLTYSTSTQSCLNQTQVTWCTVSAGGLRFSLHRQAGTGSCTASSQRLADDLVASSVFLYEPASTANLAKLRATFEIRSSGMRGSLTLCDVLVLRNSVRTGTDVDPAIQCA